jgi:hypothetical protein
VLVSMPSVTAGIELALAATPASSAPAEPLAEAGPVRTGDLLAALSRPPLATAYAATAVPETTITAILAAARQMTPLSGHRQPAVYVAIAAQGIHRTTASGALAGQVADAHLVRALTTVYPAAPVLLLVCDTVTGGPRSHQDALVSAAALGYSAWLTARREGLDGRLCPDASALVTAIARADGHNRRRHLLTVALGWPGTGVQRAERK